MANLTAESTVQPLILELLSRRNWFDSQRLDQIEETLQECQTRHLGGGDPDPGGYISEQEVATVYAEDLFLPVINEQCRGRRGR